MNDLFRILLKAFGMQPGGCEIEPLGQGHIHDTFAVCRKNPTQPAAILQKINTHVFPNVELLMHNMELVTGHIAARNRTRGKDPAANGIVLLETEDRKSWMDLGEAGCWRMFWMIGGQLTHNIATGPGIAREGGRAIGDFQLMLSDLDPYSIGDTIPGFHDFHGRLIQFENAIDRSEKLRLHQAEDLIHKVKDQQGAAERPFRLSIEKGIPLRLTHNDTKYNNILFSSDGTATCMIDLDTVMKGLCWYDFGDALRTCASNAPEDEQDPGKIAFSIAIFKSFAEGYLDAASPFITPDETDILHLAPGAFAYLQGVRFLTDFLAGDPYYKTGYPEHNLVRARSQYTLYERIAEVEEELKAIVEQLL